MYEPNRQRDPEADLGSVAPEIGRAGVRVALLLILPSAAMLAFLPRGSAEFVITVITMAIGVLFLGVVAGLLWVVNHRL
jgi:hypothetical protein